MGQSTHRTCALTFLFSVSISLLLIQAGQAQTTNSIRDRVNAGTVTVLTGGVDYVSNTYMRLATEMAAELDKEGEIRVLPIAGYGGVKNIRDLLYLRNVDMAMLHSDILAYLQQNELYPAAARRLRHVFKLYDEVFHVAARDGIQSVDDLDGKRVIVGKPGSGGRQSSEALFGLLGIQPDFVHVPWEDAIEEIKNGNADAMAYGTYKPSRLFRFMSAETWEGLKFLELPGNEELLLVYETDQLIHESYPNIIPEGKPVTTLKFAAILASFDWQPDSARYEPIKRFVTRLFEKMRDFQKEPRDRRWKDVDLDATVPNWSRFRPAEEWLVATAEARRAQDQQRLLSDGDRPVAFSEFATFMREKVGKEDATNEQLRRLYDSLFD